MTSDNRPKQSRVKRITLWTAGSLMVLAVLGEAVARFVFGLADPPLYITDPAIEYLSAPNQDCRYLGNRIAYNQWSMRSDAMAREKENVDEFRVLIVGDSVIAGGVKIDQAELATELLKPMLDRMLDRPVRVGNISAGGWGPPNQLAYLRRFGFFDADCIVFILSSGDYGDAPGKANIGIDPAFPDAKPVSALAALIERALSSRARNARRAERQSQERVAEPADVARAMRALDEMLDLARENVPTVLAAVHLQKREAEGHLQPGHAEIRAALQENEVSVIELGPAFVDALETGEDPYIDWIHPTPLGQTLIAQALSDGIARAVDGGAHSE